MSILVFKSKKQRVDPEKCYWTNQDLADFYRAKDILDQAGLNTETDSGVSDEGDPWFVFIRPETGDVVAHFAQTDGRFIAVSSLNQEVYQGTDIRGIVDQMLERHPMLLPQNKSGGRVLLHPTAALSAFLAAAFIIAVDGVKASDLTTVIIGARTGNLEDIIDEPALINYNHQEESLRGVLSDLDPSNYNVVVLGAALIAYELSQNEFHFNESPRTGENIFGPASEEAKLKEENAETLVLGVEQHRVLSEKAGESFFFQDIDLDENDHHDDTVISVFSSTEIQNKKSIAEDFVLIESPMETSHILARDLQESWSHIDVMPNVNHHSVYANVAVRIEGRLETTAQFDNKPTDETTDLSLFALLEQFQGVFQGIPSGLNPAELSNLDGLSVRIDEGGGLKVISLGDMDLYNELAILQDTSFVSLHGSGSYTDDVVTIDPGGLEYFDTEKEIITVEEPTSVPQNNQVPILGHVLENTGETLELTEAIDVVFYKGGDVQISKFELGTDLLWFFLSPEQLIGSKNSVNDSGDLELEFGDLGTLTFFGMLNDTSLDISV